MKDYVTAFRAQGLAPGLYYSIYDSTEGIGNDPANVTPAQMQYVTKQITELLTNYGPIPLLIFDGWAWKVGHRAVPYDQIRALVKSLQPDCLMLDNSHLMGPWENDLAGIEEGAEDIINPDNTFPAVQMQNKINASGGNDWFWAPDIGDLMTVDDVGRGSTSRAHRAVLDELPAQLPAQPRRPARRRQSSLSSWARWARPGARTPTARRCRRSRRKSNVRPTIPSARPPPAACPGPTPLTGWTTGTT